MPHQILTFDRHADIELLIGLEAGKRAHILQCCSRSLARASSVFARILDEHYTEEKSRDSRSPTSSCLIPLPNCDPAPLTILLNIIHGHFQRVSREITIEGLYDLVCLANDFDAKRALAPWAEAWIASIHRQLSGDREAEFRALWICWELQSLDLFETIVRRLFWRSRKSDFDNIYTNTSFHAPPGIVDRMMTIRLQTIGKLLTAIKDLVKSLIVMEEIPSWIQYAKWISARKYESRALGSLMLRLTKIGLWPIPEPHDTEESIHELRSKISGFVFYDTDPRLEKEGKYEHGRYANLVSRLLDKVSEAVAERDDLLGDFHRHHFDT